jgi:hypothetical protein
LQNVVDHRVVPKTGTQDAALGGAVVGWETFKGIRQEASFLRLADSGFAPTGQASAFALAAC